MVCVLTLVIEPLTACNANFVIELKPEGMVSNEDRTASVGSERCEMILRESSSRIGLPGTTHASVGGDAVTQG
jgi:hypothetical protein